MGLPGLLIGIVGSGQWSGDYIGHGRGPVTTLDTARQMSLMIDGVA